MKRFKSLLEIPVDCIAAPSVHFAPRPGAIPIGRLDDCVYYALADVSELRTEADWKRDGRRVKRGAQPIARRGMNESPQVYADWQVE
jgi:hypothetical protein